MSSRQPECMVLECGLCQCIDMCAEHGPAALCCVAAMPLPSSMLLCCWLAPALQDVLVNAAGERYIVLDMLGSGTFGQVVAAYSEAAGKPVAVKVRASSSSSSSRKACHCAGAAY